MQICVFMPGKPQISMHMWDTQFTDYSVTLQLEVLLDMSINEFSNLRRNSQFKLELAQDARTIIMSDAQGLRFGIVLTTGQESKCSILTRYLSRGHDLTVYLNESNHPRGEDEVCITLEVPCTFFALAEIQKDLVTRMFHCCDVDLPSLKSVCTHSGMENRKRQMGPEGSTQTLPCQNKRQKMYKTRTKKLVTDEDEERGAGGGAVGHVTHPATTNEWVSIGGVKLTHKLRESLGNNEWLDDVSIHALQTLVQEKYTLAPTLSPLLVKYRRKLQQRMLQVVHAEKDHWILISNLGHERTHVALYDTLDRGLTSERSKAIRAMYDEPLLLKLYKVPRQIGYNNCGDYCIAIAVTLAIGLDPCRITFDFTKMREHLLECMSSKSIAPFPTL